MGIKSLEELKAIREEHLSRIALRRAAGQEAAPGAEIEILVGMATCGIAAGARETMNALVSGIAERGIRSVRIIPVGCAGFCRHEPIVQVNVPGEAPVAYGNVTKERAAEIIESHVINKIPVKDMTVDLGPGLKI